MLSPNSLEMFPQGIKGVVLEPIALFQFGRVNCRGSWRARLHEISCQTTLLPGQPILAIGREGISLIVIPVHSILWASYLDDFAQFITPTELEEIQRYDGGSEKW
jgi:hypothetical protein